jgi:uncharacterized membrane protein YeiH
MDLNPLSGTTAALREAIPNLVGLLPWLDYVGVGVFAVTRALVGAKNRQDIVTCAFFAVLTGVGGGTVRDLLIGARVFWIERAGYLEVCPDRGRHCVRPEHRPLARESVHLARCDLGLVRFALEFLTVADQ